MHIVDGDRDLQILWIFCTPILVDVDEFFEFLQNWFQLWLVFFLR